MVEILEVLIEHDKKFKIIEIKEKLVAVEEIKVSRSKVVKLA